MIERLLPGLAALSLEELYEELTERGIVFALASEKGAVRSMLTRTGLTASSGRRALLPYGCGGGRGPGSQRALWCVRQLGHQPPGG